MSEHTIEKQNKKEKTKKTNLSYVLTEMLTSAVSYEVTALLTLDFPLGFLVSVDTTFDSVSNADSHDIEMMHSNPHIVR